MSFVDLNTLTMHRRNELENRIADFLGKCDQAESSINKLKMEAGQLIDQLNCEPSKLKDRFLSCMSKLDSFTYVLTDFNLSIANLDDAQHCREETPVYEVNTQKPLLPTTNLFDLLSEPTPSTSTACMNKCRVPKKVSKRKKVPLDDVLIEFSSSSCSRESVPGDRCKIPVVKTEIEEEVPIQEMQKMTISVPGPVYIVEKINLPAQKILEADMTHVGLIMHVYGSSLWIILDEINEAHTLMLDMQEYYDKSKPAGLSANQLKQMTYCAYYDHETSGYYRCFYLDMDENTDEVELFLVDTGEVKLTKVELVQPLAAQFCSQAPFARCCHLSGIVLLDSDCKEVVDSYEQYLKTFIGILSEVKIDEDTSESLGVRINLPTKGLLNKLVVDQGFAVPEKNTPEPATKAVNCLRGPAEILEDHLDIANCEEYDDPVEAVTGYHSRGEAEICKHYKGGPNKTCFKGARCTKKHIVKHPDGWSLDRVEVRRGRPLQDLPQPGSWCRVRVTWVSNFNLIYVQLLNHQKPEKERSFGEVIPPMTLTSLVQDMNSEAGRASLRKLEFPAAEGELVAALYRDDQWYRATVKAKQNNEQSVQVLYVDFGNDCWIKEDKIRQLDMAHTVLPYQAVPCRLAGVVSANDDVTSWVRARNELSGLALNKELEVKVISRELEELEIELYDEGGCNIAHILAAKGFVNLVPYQVFDDKRTTRVGPAL